MTLVLRSSGGPLAVSLDAKSGRITDIGGKLGTDVMEKFLFTGIYIVSPEFLAKIPADEVISVIPIFLEMIRQGAKLGGVVLDEGHWWDLGTRDQYLAVHRYLKHAEQSAFASGYWIAPNARIAPTAQISGATAIGAGAVVGEGRGWRAA